MDPVTPPQTLTHTRKSRPTLTRWWGVVTLVALIWTGQSPEPVRLILAAACIAATGLAWVYGRRPAAPSPVRWTLRQRLTLGVLLALTVAGSGFGGLAYAAANRLVHPSRQAVDCESTALGLPATQTIQFESTDGITLRGWYFPAHNGAAVIFAHGLGRNRCRLAQEAALLVQRGYGALLYDSRNAGDSDGSLTTLGALEMNDVLGAVRYLRAQSGGATLHLGAYGHSMSGASVARAAAVSPDLEAVVIVSSFSSMKDNVAAGVSGLTGLPAFPFAPLVLFFAQQAAGISLDTVQPAESLRALGNRPVLILHGTADTLLPPDNARRLYAAASGPKDLLLVPGLGHWCCLLPEGEDQPTRTTVEQTLVAFWEKALPPQP